MIINYKKEKKRDKTNFKEKKIKKKDNIIFIILINNVLSIYIGVMY